ncbi:PGF-CTERM sorting domain-containing protein [Haloarcula salina]|uniref:PGF-CTERM sorting domain-containing protein n=1 Tax=Haloarcula salina TaxID=1429914 RepID=UPI003C6FF0BA
MAVALVLVAPLAVTAPAGATPVAEGQTTSLSDNVDIWNRSPLPLRTTTNGSTTVVAPRTFINVESAATGDLPVNKRTVTVYDRNQTVNMSFESRVGAGTTALAGDEAQLLAVNLTASPSAEGVGNGSVQMNLERLFRNNSNVTSAELLDDAEGVGTFDEDGELDASYTPESSGAYAFVLVSVDDGPGVSVEDDSVSVDGNVTVVGVEQALVRENASTVEPTENRLNPGDNVTLDVETDLENESATHAVMLVRKGELQRQSSTVRVTGELDENFSSEQVSVETSWDRVSGVATIENGTMIGNTNVTDLQTIPATGFAGLFGMVLSGATTTGNASGEVIHASATVASDGPNANVTVETLDSWPNGAYEYVHVAVSNETGTVYTDSGTVALSQAGGQNGQGPPDNAGGPGETGPPDNAGGPNDDETDEE